MLRKWAPDEPSQLAKLSLTNPVLDLLMSHLVLLWSVDINVNRKFQVVLFIDHVDGNAAKYWSFIHGCEDVLSLTWHIMGQLCISTKSINWHYNWKYCDKDHYRPIYLCLCISGNHHSTAIPENTRNLYKSMVRKWIFRLPQTTSCIFFHYSDVRMSAMASKMTSVSIVYSTVCSGADQRKHRSSASLAFVCVWGGG